MPRKQRPEAERLTRLGQPGRRALRDGSVLSALAALVWLPQAAVVALAVSGFLDAGFALNGGASVGAGAAYGILPAAADTVPAEPGALADGAGGVFGSGPMAVAVPVALFIALGMLRALLGWMAEARLQRAAEQVVTAARARILAGELARADGAAHQGERPEKDSPLQDSSRNDLSRNDLSRDDSPGKGAAVQGAGAIAALAGEKLELLGAWVSRYAPAQARVMLVPPLILAVAFWHSWAVGLVLLVAGPLIPVFMALVGMAAREASARQLAEVGTMNDLLVERLSALVDIRLLGAGEQVLRGFARSAAELRRRTMAVLGVAFLSSTVLELFAAIGTAMVAVWVGFTLLGQLEFGTWGGTLTPAAGIFLLLIVPDYFQPLRDLAAAWHDRAAAAAVADELAAWEAGLGPRLPGKGARAERGSGPASIRLSGCRLPGRALLPDMDIRPGESVALVGPSGSGKTSALRLMAGLQLPESGELRLGGAVLDDANADAWRARLGWMPQAPHFLDVPLAQNLAMGRGGDLAPAIRTAAAEAVVAALPQGLATRLGETGGGLSGGESRRLTLARAVHGAPDIVLADEPTADLDPATARAVTEGLLAEAARGATLVVATHDPELAARMDRVIRLGEAA